MIAWPKPVAGAVRRAGRQLPGAVGKRFRLRPVAGRCHPLCAMPSARKPKRETVRAGLAAGGDTAAGQRDVGRQFDELPMLS